MSRNDSSSLGANNTCCQQPDNDKCGEAEYAVEGVPMDADAQVEPKRHTSLSEPVQKIRQGLPMSGKLRQFMPNMPQ